MANEPESREPETNNQLDPFEALNSMRDASLKTWSAMRDASLESLRSMRDASLESWSKVMIDFVNSEAYSRSTAEWLDNYLMVSQPLQRTIETTVTRALTSVNMPVRTDVISLAERLTNVEMRLDDLDAKLDDIQRAIQALASSPRLPDTGTPPSRRAVNQPTPRSRAKAKETR